MAIPDEKILNELRKISKLLVLSNAKVIEVELNKIASNDARKKMWVLIDGKKMPKDLAKETRVTAMAVSNFLNAALAGGLIEYAPRQPPIRALDYVPPSWLSLVKLPDVGMMNEAEMPIEKVEDKTEKGESNG